MLILSNPLLEFCLSAPAFSSIILFQKVCPSNWYIENSRASLWYPRYSEKGNLHAHFASTFSLNMPISHESEHIKLMTSPIINLLLAVFYWQSLYCEIEVIDNCQGDFNSSNSKYCPLCPPWSISVALLFFEGCNSIFCVQIRPRQSLHTVYFWIFAAPVVWSTLRLQSCALPSWFQSSNHF